MTSEPPALPTLARRRSIQRNVIAWFAEAQRALPWRRDPTPYHVWIAEIMAQQTRLAAVQPYYERFLKRFPDVATLAAAPLDDVLAAWSGLGYYRRAHHLHHAARLVVNRYGGQLPSDVLELQQLPGIGRYTAGAIASIAFGRPVPLLDGNVMRVFTRLYDLSGDITRSGTRSELWRLVEAHVPTDDPRSYNEGLMELGALVCTPRSPACSQCPIRGSCRAQQNGTVALRPVKKAKAEPVNVRLLSVLVRNLAGAVLLARQNDQGIYAGLWGLPHCPAVGHNDRQTLAAGLKLPMKFGRKLGRIEHVLTHRRLILDLYTAELTAPLPLRDGSFRWVRNNADLAKLGVSRLTRRALAIAWD